ncbi:hypothetical protein RND71_009181 [Anisodus tanguticus]|uniref:Uncharacterized protein n=1 Tax=Anisodus tanguticus TaxID=243964 RepID=A0AAE1SHC3_9SOLA|nr:hypothetical protein RND71_009181 [Anisodus tanguticus]
MGDGSEEIEVIPSWCAPRTLSTSIMCYFSQRNDIEVLGEPLYAKFLQVTGVDRLYKEELRSGMVTYDLRISDGVLSRKLFRISFHFGRQLLLFEAGVMFNGTLETLMSQES